MSFSKSLPCIKSSNFYLKFPAPCSGALSSDSYLSRFPLTALSFFAEGSGIEKGVFGAGVCGCGTAQHVL